MATDNKPQGCTNLKLRQLGRMVTRHYDRHLSEVGLKITQYSLLSHVVILGPIRPGDLARHMQMDVSTLTRNLRPLEAQGWLKIGKGEDARSRLIAATAEGKRQRTQGQRAWKAAQLALNELLGSERVLALHELLDSSIETLDKVNRPGLPGHPKTSRNGSSRTGKAPGERSSSRAVERLEV